MQSPPPGYPVSSELQNHLLTLGVPDLPEVHYKRSKGESKPKEVPLLVHIR